MAVMWMTGRKVNTHTQSCQNVQQVPVEILNIDPAIGKCFCKSFQILNQMLANTFEKSIEKLKYKIQNTNAMH